MKINSKLIVFCLSFALIFTSLLIPVNTYAESLSSSIGDEAANIVKEQQAHPNMIDVTCPKSVIVKSTDLTSITIAVRKPVSKNNYYDANQFVIEYSKNSNMSDAKTLYVVPSSAELQNVVLKGLDKGTRYYIRVRGLYVKSSFKKYSSGLVSIYAATTDNVFFGTSNMNNMLWHMKNDKPSSDSKVKIIFQSQLAMSENSFIYSIYKAEALYQQYFQRFVGRSFCYYWRQNGNRRVYTGVGFKVARSASTAANRNSKVNSKVNSIVAAAKKYKSTRDRIKYVDKALCKLISYDTTKKRSESTNIYGALIEKKAVCKGYSEAFYACMYRLKIPCDFVSNVNGTHIWNQVKIGNTWYHIDTCWNDTGNKSNQKYFLLSGASMNKVKNHRYK